MNIAIQNIHLTPNLHDVGIHNYILDLVREGHVKYLYFSERNPENVARAIRKLLKHEWYGIDWNKVEFIFSGRTLRSKCDVLLNFNNYTREKDFVSSVKRFDGLKIWHVLDYFWNEPGSALSNRLEKYGIDYLFGYSSHDKYCRYFQKTFPKYHGKVLPIPFGFTNRFKSQIPFEKRLNKCVAVGSVNPLRPLDSPIHCFQETADFYPDEAWFHKFRRRIVLNQLNLTPTVDSMLPTFPQIKDFKYDLVAKFNEYRMFVCCESIFYFPAAKTYEGPATGSVLICSDHDCFKDLGFRDGENCVMHCRDSIEDFQSKVRYYQEHESELKSIQARGTTFVREHFNHKAIAGRIYNQIQEVFSKSSNACNSIGVPRG